MRGMLLAGHEQRMNAVHRPVIAARHDRPVEQRRLTMKKLVTALAAVTFAAAIAVWSPWASSAGAGSGSPYEPSLAAADFTTTIDNPYFPLPVGRTLVYRGVKDGQTQE